MMTSLILVFRHCIPQGEEQGKINELVADALTRFDGLYEDVDLRWEDERCVFHYRIPLTNPERGRSVLEEMGISIPSYLIPSSIPSHITVMGVIYLHCRKIRIEVEHTEIGGLVGRGLKPLIRRVVNRLIEKMAAKRGVAVTAE